MYYYVIQFNIYPQWLLTPIPTIWCRSYSGRNNTPQGQMMAVSTIKLLYHIKFSLPVFSNHNLCLQPVRELL